MERLLYLLKLEVRLSNQIVQDLAVPGSGDRNRSWRQKGFKESIKSIDFGTARKSEDESTSFCLFIIFVFRRNQVFR